MDTRNASRAWVRPELVPMGRVEVVTLGSPGLDVEVGMPKEVAF